MMRDDKPEMVSSRSIGHSGADGPDEASEPDATKPEDIRDEVRRIIGSAEFDASERNRRFLEYVVEETLAGRGERIKAYTIATTVFGRDVHFDPQLDPVVRMEARRLRRSLERFYLTEGRQSLVRITMPKGAYVPEFDHRRNLDPNDPNEAADAPNRTGYVSSILVKQFELDGDDSIFLNYEHGLTRQLMIGLCRYPQLRVFASKPYSQRFGASDEETLLMDRDADFVLTGSKAMIGGRLQVKAVLLEARTGRVLWGQGFERDLQPDGFLKVRDDVANLIVQRVAQPFGVIFNHRAAKVIEKDSPASLLDCLVLFHRYRRSLRRDLFGQAREGLERILASHPTCAEAFAYLSHLNTDGHRFGFAPGEPPAALKKNAVTLALKAIEIAPDSSCGFHALGSACWFEKDVQASLGATQTALSLNGNAAEVVADLGLHWSLLGHWERAIPLLDRADAMGPTHVTSHHLGRSLHHFCAGRFEQALAISRKIHAPDVTHGHVWQAICLIRLGRREEAAEAVSTILELDPHYGRGSDGVVPDLTGGNLDPGLAEQIGGALAEAGLPEPGPGPGSITC